MDGEKREEPEDCGMPASGRLHPDGKPGSEACVGEDSAPAAGAARADVKRGADIRGMV